jgi:hypothetical protein
MKFLIGGVLMTVLVMIPGVPAQAEVGGTITRSTSVPYEQLSYHGKLQYIMARLLEIQALLTAMIEAESATPLTTAEGTINFQTGRTVVDVTLNTGAKERLTLETTRESEILATLATEYKTGLELVRNRTRLTTLFADEPVAIGVRFRDNRSITIREEQRNGTIETYTVSSREVIDDFLVPLVGSRTLAQTIYDGYVADIRRGNVSEDTYELLGELLGQPVTPEFIEAITFTF